MSKFDYLLVTILTATSDNNIGFAELRSFLKGLGFDERIKGGHFIFSKTGVAEIVNIQPEGNIDPARICLKFSVRAEVSKPTTLRYLRANVLQTSTGRINKAKAYQVKQVRNLILKYKLARELS